MKKLIPAICILLSILISLPVYAKSASIERRGLFVSVIQEPWVLSSRSDIEKLVAYAKIARVNILFVQIYRANKAWFPTKIADHEPFDTCLKEVSEDPLKLLIRKAHAEGIQVHAWLNMLSLSKNKDAVILKKYGPEILTRNRIKKNALEDYEIDDQYFLEPGDTRVRGDLVDMVGEILRTYPGLDGIQFDYIRYPDMHPAYGYTKMNMDRFKSSTGIANIDETSILWKDWKREQVTAFLEELVEKTRQVRPDIQISTTGCAPYSRAYHEAFQDWPSWLERGLIDFVTIMTYSPDTVEFEKFIIDVKKRVADPDKVNIAIGAYEMIGSPATPVKEIDLCQKYGFENCVIFHYGSLLDDPKLGSSVSNRFNTKK
jgi:uncharacterized lipoprotein YddW (UPF0748 family)